MLLAKKRYVGYKKESLKGPYIFDAKGIETVRRDGSHLGQKVMKNVLQILFETKDLSKIKKYIIQVWSDIEQNKINFKEYTIAKEIKSNYKVPPP